MSRNLLSTHRLFEPTIDPNDKAVFATGQPSCRACEGRGWVFDDDPALDFGGPANYRIPCDCMFKEAKP